MKESKFIFYVLLLTTLLLTMFSLLFGYLNPNNNVAFSIVSNIYCGLIVGLITSISQYFAQKRVIVNKVYNEYFDIYRTYYYSKNCSFLLHYNVFSVYKKMMDLNPNICGYLDDYTGLVRKKDKTYKKMNPTIKLGSSFKIKNILKTFRWFNKKDFHNTLEPIILEIENILFSINSKRFQKDKQELQNLHNYMFDLKI